MRREFIVGWACVAALASARPVQAGPAEPPTTDEVAVAKMLYADELYDRAAAVLETIDPAGETIDRPAYWLLRGLVDLQRDRGADAALHLGAAIASGESAPKVYLLKAQAEVSAGLLDHAVRTLSSAPDTIRTFPESYLLQARALYQLGRKHASFVAIDAGFAAFPEHPQMERQRMFLLVELGLYQQAQAAARQLFAHHPSEPPDHVALAEALRRGGQLPRARQVLEEANLRFANNPDIRTQLAVTYLDLGQPVVAAEVLRPLAWMDAERAMHTAELYRKGGAYGRATRMNQRVSDQKAKFRQRLGLLLEQEQFELAASLHPRVARLGLLEEPSIVYGMAYAFFQIRDFDRAEALIAQITDEKLFEQGITIRRAIEACRQADWQCD